MESVSYQPAFDNVLRGQIEGSKKTRRRFTKVPEVLSCKLYVDHAQLQTLLDFYEITLQTVLPFDWHDWRKPNDAEFGAVFKFRSYPTHRTWGADGYEVQLELDQLTTFQGAFLLNIEGLST